MSDEDFKKFREATMADIYKTCGIKPELLTGKDNRETTGAAAMDRWIRENPKTYLDRFEDMLRKRGVEIDGK